MNDRGNEKSTRRSKGSPVERKVGYHHGNLSQALLDGGLHLLSTAGIDGLTLRECARLAGVSQAAIRNHFPDKNALLAGLAARGFEQLSMRRSARQKTSLDLGGWLLLIIDNYVGFAIEFPGLFRLMFAFKALKRSDYPALNAAAHEAYDALCSTLASILEAEKIGSADIGTAAFMLWSSMHGLAMLVIDDQYGPTIATRISPQQRCLQLADLLAAGWRNAHRSARSAAKRSLAGRK